MFDRNDSQVRIWAENAQAMTPTKQYASSISRFLRDSKLLRMIPQSLVHYRNLGLFVSLIFPRFFWISDGNGLWGIFSDGPFHIANI